VTTIPYTDGTLTLRRWRIRQAVAAMQRARRDADDEAAATVRKCKPVQHVRTSPSSVSQPAVVTASWPPDLIVAALVVAVITVGGIVGLGSRYDIAAMMPGRGAGSDVVEPATATAASATEWRDDVGEVAK